MSRKRTIFNVHQTEVLELVFNQTHFLSTPLRRKISKEINLEEGKVQKWFQNRRAKERTLKRMISDLKKNQSTEPHPSDSSVQNSKSQEMQQNNSQGGSSQLSFFISTPAKLPAQITEEIQKISKRDVFCRTLHASHPSAPTESLGSSSPSPVSSPQNYSRESSLSPAASPRESTEYREDGKTGPCHYRPTPWDSQAQKTYPPCSLGNGLAEPLLYKAAATQQSYKAEEADLQKNDRRALIQNFFDTFSNCTPAYVSTPTPTPTPTPTIPSPTPTFSYPSPSPSSCASSSSTSSWIAGQKNLNTKKYEEDMDLSSDLPHENNNPTFLLDSNQTYRPEVKDEPQFVFDDNKTSLSTNQLNNNNSSSNLQNYFNLDNQFQDSFDELCRLFALQEGQTRPGDDDQWKQFLSDDFFPVIGLPAEIRLEN